MAVQEIRVPDLEGAENLGVVEVYVAAGDAVEPESPLISLESDKAVLDVPSPLAGTITELKVSEGDTVNVGDLIALAESTGGMTREAAEDEADSPDAGGPAASAASGGGGAGAAQAGTPGGGGPEGSGASPGGSGAPAPGGAPSAAPVEIPVPDLEGAADVAVVEVYVSEGEHVDVDAPLISLESDKAVMDVPSPLSGTITALKVSEGDTVNTGDVIGLIRGDGAAPESAAPAASPAAPEAAHPPQAAPSPPGGPTAPGGPSESPTPPPAAPEAAHPPQAAPPPVNLQEPGSKYHAAPSVRSLARELGVELSRVQGSGPKGRITRDDVSALVKSVMNSGFSAGAAGALHAGAAGAFALPPIPSADYAAFGAVQEVKLSRIKKISGPHLHRNWVGVPHVTQFEDADITELEAFRRSLNEDAVKTGLTKVSPLIFIIKAAVNALKAFPDFNSSLNPEGASVTRKSYYNLGIAVDTPEGLVVPVIKNADSKGIRELADELGDLSTRARAGKLKADEMKGGTFSISSLGGIGGTYFTPIVNAPEVAILGLSKSAMQPVWNGAEFLPRLILPFSVSYDHRVIDGAQGARFAAHLSRVIGDIRLALL